LCVYGEAERSLSGEILRFLSRLGDLAALSIANAAAYDELKKLDEAKSGFLRKAAHELVSPLSVIQSLALTLLEGYLGDLTDRQRAEIERIRARAGGLSAVVGDLLDLAQLQAHTASGAATASQEMVDLPAALAEIVSFYEAAAADKGVGLSVSTLAGPLPVRGSAEGIRSILTNLLSNALKYTPAGGTVSVLLGTAGEQVELTVSDTGIGVPAGEKEKLFSEFFRASNARSYTDAGTGLGLAVVKAEVRALGGSVALASVEGEGTTVRVLLPVKG
jgi:signal transduction histidine kinase